MDEAADAERTHDGVRVVYLSLARAAEASSI
jgi:hypothetical protein